MSSFRKQFDTTKAQGILKVMKDGAYGFFRALLPVLIYYAIMLLVDFFLGLFLGGTGIEIWTPVVEALGALAALPYLLKTYRKDILMRVLSDEYRRRRNFPLKEKAFRYGYAAITICFIALAVNNIIGYSDLEEISELYAQVHYELYQGPFFVRFLCLGLVVPYAEEVLYRGVFFGRMKEIGSPVKAIIVSALVFGIMHGNLVQLVYGFFVGLVLAYFADKNQSVLPAFIGHAAANTVAMIRQEVGNPLANAPLVDMAVTVILLGAGLALFFVQFRVDRLK